MKKTILSTAFMLAVLAGQATNYYLSPTGSDTNDGLSPRTAWATVGAAAAVLRAGDCLLIQPGTYSVTEHEIAREEGPYAIVFDMKMRGTAARPISLIGISDKDGRRPVFDFSRVKPRDRRVTGFYITGAYLVFRNFETTGIQVTQTGHTQSENFRLSNAVHCTLEHLAAHDGMGIGVYIMRNSRRNLILNCDAYNNYDSVSEHGRGGNSDGFGCHVASPADLGNLFIGCRAWCNSDDGFDFINCHAPSTFAYSFAFRNGYSVSADGSYTARADGNGFKSGGYGMAARDIRLQGSAPMHQVLHCVAAFNASNGIYSNHHIGGIRFEDNTSYSNGRYNYNMVNRTDATAAGNVDVNGYGHIVLRNLSAGAHCPALHVGWMNGGTDSCTVSGNSFTWDPHSRTWTNREPEPASFMTIDADRLTAPRLPGGMLDPATTLTFLKQKTRTGLGADFGGYRQAVKAAIRLTGARSAEDTKPITLP